MALTKIQAAGLTADLIDETKLADDSIDSEHYNAASIDNEHLADDAVGVDELSATGTASSSTFLRGDNSWATPTDTNTVYTHPNHSGEVTSTADGAQVIADDVVDEANLKISNAGSNGQFLSKQSGNTGGLTWADAGSVGGATGVDFNDNVKARFGTGNDLEIYHDASHSYIHNSGTGNLQVKSDESLYLRVKENEEAINCNADGSVQLYHDNTKQCETSANGLAFPSGKGIDFSAQTATSASGASMSEEVLDHYEVGTWTPYWWGYHHGNAGWQAWPMDTAGSASGRYIRVGNVVHVWCKLSGFEMDNSSSSYPSIAGLPFSGVAETAFGSAGYSDVFSNNSSEHSVTGKISDGTKIGWMCNSKSNPTINGSSNRTFVGGITYFVS